MYLLPRERPLAKVLTVALWAVGVAYMVQSGLQVPEPDYVALYATPIVWVVAIALPILAHVAFGQREWLAAILLTIAAIIGSAYTLTGTISRQSESRDAKMAVVEASNFNIDEKKAELARATQRRDDAQRFADDERQNGCGKRCQDWELRAKEVQASIDQITAQISAGPAHRPVLSGETRIATFISWLPGMSNRHEQIEQVVATVTPCHFGLFVELAALALGYFGWRPGSEKRTETVSRPVARTERVHAKHGSAMTETVSDEDRATIQALSRAGKPVTNDQLARLMRCSKSESSKRVAALNGRVLKHRDPDDARQVRISLLN